MVVALGQGGMGTIHLALASGLGDFRKLLVVKELRRDLSTDPRFVEMFFNEAKLAARLNHPNVVQTLEAGQQGDRYFLSMEFLDGRPFSALLSAAATSTTAAPLSIRLKILCDALTGLHYAHELTEYDGTNIGIVHRDVSPQNIFITYDGQVKVVDFGIAAATNTLTSSTVFTGKFGYAAPEQLLGRRVDARTDLFAMGVILWETLTLRRFASGPAEQRSVTDRLEGREPRLSELDIDVDERLSAICDKALQIDPDKRFATAAEFRAALESFLVQTGQYVDSSTIGAALMEHFADERKALHQRIDQHLKGITEAAAEAEASAPAEQQDGPTVVADLSRYMHATRIIATRRGKDRVQPAAPARRKPIAIGGTALAIGLLVAVTLGRSSDEISSSATEDTAIAALQSVGPQVASRESPATSTDLSELASDASAATLIDIQIDAATDITAAKATAAAKVGSSPQIARAVRRTRRTPNKSVDRPAAAEPAATEAAQSDNGLSLTDTQPRDPLPSTTRPRVAAAGLSGAVDLGDDLSHLGTDHSRRSIDTDL